MFVWGLLSLLERTRKSKQGDISQIKVSRAETVIDYSVYRLSVQERVMAVVVASGSLYAVGYLFYKQPLISLIMAALGLFYPKWISRKKMIKRKAELNDQFRQALFSLSSSLTAGKSVESGLAEAVNDLKTLYSNPNTYIIAEFDRMNRKIQNGETIEAVLREFDERADLEDIHNFVDVFVTCKRSGGNLIEVVRRTANIIGEKIEIQQEIAVLIAQKKFESAILSAAPLAVIGLLTISSPDYMAPLYSGLAGPLIMTLCLVLLLGCHWLVKKIMDIKV
ncbi:type II secretion system F family protein [Paenibacillus sp. 32O-W]|uniref:type II secretion system F family protein n=1 Tax=Paenibacillus sp. 32O-W TaxID=1695218 RepID=UPI0021B5D7E9|nr:type II secretion system F family protein [Paenibacillus sp. 32O-W]